MNPLPLKLFSNGTVTRVRMAGIKLHLQKDKSALE